MSRAFNDFERRFRANLRQLRAAKGLRQADVHGHGLTAELYRHVEQGNRRPSFETLFRIAQVFGVRPTELLDVEHVDPEVGKVARGGPRHRGLPAGRSQN